MSRKKKSRNAADAEPEWCVVRIFRDFHQIYAESQCGLIAIAQSVGVTLLPPRKITVMLMGNQSAGKSSFINWYVEEDVRENQCFTFVTSGCKSESLMGNETFQLYPHFKALQEVKGVSQYITTEICTSQKKCFSMLTFVDTPGVVDGDMKYPFDVDQAILCLGDVCDLILVFFDPMGQALCKRTLNIVEQLNEKQGDRLRFYLSKADEAGGESDRQNVIMRIVHELSTRSGLKKCAFHIPAIYIPNPKKPSGCINMIDEVCQTIEQAINKTMRNTLATLEKDCELICEAVADTFTNDQQCFKENRNARVFSCVLSLMGFSLLPVFTLILDKHQWESLVLALGTFGTEILLLYLAPVTKVLDYVPLQIKLIICGFLMQLCVILLMLAYILIPTKATLSEKQKIQLQENLEFVQKVVMTKKKELCEEYRQWRAGDRDTD